MLIVYNFFLILMHFGMSREFWLPNRNHPHEYNGTGVGPHDCSHPSSMSSVVTLSLVTLRSKCQRVDPNIKALTFSYGKVAVYFLPNRKNESELRKFNLAGAFYYIQWLSVSYTLVIR